MLIWVWTISLGYYVMCVLVCYCRIVGFGVLYSDDVGFVLGLLVGLWFMFLWVEFCCVAWLTDCWVLF